MRALLFVALTACAHAPRPAPLPSAAVTLHYARRHAEAEAPTMKPCPLAWTSSLAVGCALAEEAR